mgnify:FL=1
MAIQSFQSSANSQKPLHGKENIFISDGLRDFPEAIETVYPHAIVWLCIVHKVRNSLNYVTWNKHKQVAADLRLI